MNPIPPQLDAICDGFETTLKAGNAPRIEAFEALDPRAVSQESIDTSPAAVSVDTVTNYHADTAADGQSSRSVNRTEQPLRTLGRFELK